MNDCTYNRLVNSCVDHFLEVLGPQLDRWAETKASRWKDNVEDEQAIEDEGHTHWQARTLKRFKLAKLFEQVMAAFLRDENCTQADFAAVLTRAHAEGAHGKESLGSLVIETMTAVDDFESFTNFMNNAVAGEHEDNSDAAPEIAAVQDGEEESKRCQLESDSSDGCNEGAADTAARRRRK
ncbi:unnamed protein product [Ectocarpus sp. 13 AM-2016]